MGQLLSLANHPEEKIEFEHHGEYYQYQVTPTIYHNHLRGYVLTLLNITKQKQETQHMERLKNQAENQTAQKSSFLARMSHDLRTPLHAIIGISDILLGQGELSAKQRTQILNMKSAGNTLLEQVNSILIYSQMEAGKLELAQKPYDLEGVIREIANYCMINLESKPVDFLVSFSTEYPAEIIGDEMQVREMLQNVLSNAVKYTEEGQITCEISCGLGRKEGEVRIECRVTDTGIGMTQEQLNQLFKEYVSFSDSRSMEGTGLGLCIVRQLAELMGGSVIATSAKHKGSTVVLTFYQKMMEGERRPATTFYKDALQWKSAEGYSTITPAYIYPNAKVLVVDDMRINCEILRELLKPWKCGVDFAFHGKEAIEAVKTKKYQMIFIDQMMPEMTGVTAAEEIQKLCDTPLIMMTADISDVVRTLCQEKGLTDFLAKPIDLKHLQRIIEIYMPEDYRSSATDSVSYETQKLYIKTLEAFVEEVGSLAEQLTYYVDNNLDLFRVKVHGIKGVSRQIGRDAVSERAEILEMAAKTGNIPFIKRYIPTFLQNLEEVLAGARRELGCMPKEQEVPVEYGGNKTVKELFELLRQGFDSYDIGLIEKEIMLLSARTLSIQEAALLENAKQAAADLEYEAGSALFARKN